MLARFFAALSLPLAIAFAFLSGSAWAAPFTPGNLVVYRIGDGAAALGSTATAVFLDEYTTGGVLVQSIGLPTTTVTTTVTNKRMTGSGSSTSEGLITRSADGQFLVAVGYDAAVGTASITGSTSASINRVVALVKSDGSVDTTTSLSDASSGSSPRGAASTDGTTIWVSGGAGGARYAVPGATTSVQLSTTPTNLRGVNVYGGQLYASSQSGAFRLATIGSGTPTTIGQTTTNLPGFPTATGSPYQFFFADLDAGVAGVDTVYVADDAGTIQKYSLVAGTWTANGTIALSSVRGLTATVSGNSVTLYVTNGTSIQTLTDTSGYNATITGSLTSIATPGTNKAFRGVALAPVPSSYALTVTHSGTGTGVTASVPAGSINCAGGSGTCSANYSVNSMVTLAATPDGGSSFTGWSGACTGSSTCTVTMDAAKSVTAIFDLNTNYALTVTHASAGSGTTVSTPGGIINCAGSSGVCSASLASGTMLTLTATPNNTSVFTGWSGDCTGTGTCSVTMNAAKNITATFASSILTVTHAGTGTGTTASVPPGTINCTGSAGVCAAGYVPGTVVTLSATPSGAAAFSGWSGACTGTASCVVTMDVAKSVTATFDLSLIGIHTVQGSGTASPFAGQLVLVEGIVTSSFQATNQLKGFFIQEPDATVDADPATSEGIFIYTNLAPVTVSPGDKVRVVGSVTEFGTAPNTLTEIVTPTVTVLSTGNPLPAVIDVTLPVANLADLERYEGMRVRFVQTLTVSDHFDLAHFGEVTLKANGRALQPTNEVDLNDDPASGTNSAPPNTNQAAVTAFDSLNQRSSIILDDADSRSYPPVIPFVDPVDHTLRLGSTVDNLTGIFSQSFGSYRLYATTTPAFNYAPRPLTPPNVGGNVKVASANVLNYFNGDGLGGGFPTARGANSLIEFNRQRAKTIAAISGLNADVVGLLEMENDGTGTNSAVQDLVNGLNAAAGPGTWAIIPDPAGYCCGNAGTTDAIRPVIVYKPAVVTPSGASSTIIDSAFNIGRAPVAQTFALVSNGEKFTLVMNHFKSKGSGGIGADGDLGDGQAFYNNTRKLQAQALLSFISTLSATTPRIITMGDFNAYEQEDPMDVLRAGGLATIINGDTSYMFNGLSGSLDHALGNAALMANISGAGHWHINADEPVFLDYNVETKVTTGCSAASCTSQDFYTTAAFRASDHDPVLVGLQLNAVQCIAGTYSATGNAPCTAASPGNFVATAGATAQTPCVAGTFQASSGATSCGAAQPGNFVATAGATSQTACLAGTFQASSGATSCGAAQPGNFVATAGATSQTACLAGTFQASSGATSCGAAQPGNFVATAGATSQTACAAGSYQPSAGQTSCALAQPGFFVATTGATSQTVCPAGTNSFNSGATSCTAVFNVTPSAGANGMISPSTVQSVAQGATASFTVTPNAGFIATVTGSCGGSLAGNTFTTSSIVADCSVVASFATAVSSTTSLGSSLNPSRAGQSVTFTATVTGNSGTPTGNVNFREGANSIVGCASVPLSGGVALCVTTGVSPGMRLITAQYAGNGVYGSSTSGALTQTVTPAGIQPFIYLMLDD